MAPIASTVSLSHLDGVSDSTRARELYKYFQPTAQVNQDSCFPSTSNSTGTTNGAAPSWGGGNLTSDVQVNSEIVSSKISSPDTALTAFCQLVTWRTGAQRAMISLIDSSTQYFIAESTKTLDLVDNRRHSPGDNLWMGCGSAAKAGRLCERTIAVQPTNSEDYPSFVVPDLSKDVRFNQLPFVMDAPRLRLYAGVPLVTQRGIPIGSLFIVDDRVWPNGVSQDDINFMGTMATTIMKHLEMAREVEEHRRGMKMSRGLASFVAGRSELVEDDADDADDGEGLKIVGQFETDQPDPSRNIKQGVESGGASVQDVVDEGSVTSVERKENEYSHVMLKTEAAIQASYESPSTRAPPATGSGPASYEATSGIGSPPLDQLDVGTSPLTKEASEAKTMKLLFSRASNLIREAFEVDGGAVFYDAQRGFSESHPINRNMFREDSQLSGDEVTSGGELFSDYEDRCLREPAGLNSESPTHEKSIFSRSSLESKKLVEILGFSTGEASSIHGDKYPGAHSFVPFNEKSLHALLSRYPRGKLWTFDSDGTISNSSDDDLTSELQKDVASVPKNILKRKRKNARFKADANFLSRHFPGVRQLLFVPLWDSGRARWLSGCCAWSTEPTRVLSKQSELAFLSAFNNSVMAECGRLDMEIADQKKGDFIGSISHELRSPLHGILASAEFLGEETLTGFERGLVETIDSCGRTLLDTINHILDFSKINHFEKNWRRNRGGGTRAAPRSGSSTTVLKRSDLPMINLFAEVDVSVVCEEVIESVFAGHVFQNVTAQSFDMVPDARGKMADSRGFLNNSLDNADQVSDVTVILDVTMQDYHFTTQPGAFRRVIMNLLGNALKYTSHGYVRVSLESRDMEDLETPGGADPIPRSMVTITVSDTGKGISSDFLRSKLFTPFAQENSLASGTGLGLSIVRSIVNLLEGEITIESEVGRGTQVRVDLPLLRDMPKSADSNPAKSMSSLPRESSESIDTLRKQLVGQRVSLCGFDSNTTDQVYQNMGVLLKNSITTFLTQWYGLQVVPLGQKASIVIANEVDSATITNLTRQGTINGKTPMVLVLCSHSTRYDRAQSNPENVKVGYIAKPVGPLKLARALLQCLEGAPPLATPGLSEPTSAGAESTDLSRVFEELSLSPLSSGVLDNSRMAAVNENARKAIESPTPIASLEKIQEFPFPNKDTAVLPTLRTNTGAGAGLLSGEHLSNAKGRYRSSSMARAGSMTNNASSPDPIPITSERPKASSMASDLMPPVNSTSPRLLLVDDNKINLKLLRTYMRKRNYLVVDEAENGLEAVHKFEGTDNSYDIIFMDISMPVLDGFGATRQIRSIEEQRWQKIREMPQEVQGIEPKKPTPALVIALTGLASSRDQNEAFSSGIDLFLTKPVAFKEVGKMLDNWEANRERDLDGANSVMPAPS